MRILRVALAGGLIVGASLAPGRAQGAEAAAPAQADQGEPPITTPGVEGDYLRAMHQRIHLRWMHGFIESIAQMRPATDPLNNPALTAEILFTVRWDGSPAEVTLVKSSGQRAFDQAALSAIRGDSPYAVPPLALFGDDGVAHFRWVFARDRRQCSEGEVRRREDPLDEALPRLFLQGRVKEALLRVQRYMDAGDVNAMAVFARTWLQRRFPDRVADANAAAALARVGDRRAAERLRPALAQADTVAVAAQGLAALKVDVCAPVEPALRARDRAPFEIALTALLEAKVAPGSPCLATLAAVVDDEAAPKPLRASALRTFAALDREGAKKRVIERLADKSPELRAAAATAIARPGGGRPMLYRLEPMLKDPSNDVRAAVAASIVRSCGEISFEYVRPLFKSNDDRPIAAMVAPLGELASPESIELLQKIEKRANPQVREQIIRALANRKDEAGRAMFKSLADPAKKSPYTSNELRAFLLAAAPLEELLPLAKDPHLGILAYKAMLRAKRHKEAADWLVFSYDRVSPEVLGEAFGAWLANPPPSLASQ
ncbi:MAG TPA: TonB family protein [Polyangia bacterium]|nr:TonB family protein [Polyangia bacterium]